MARGRIPERDIAAIRERTPLDEIVSEYVSLKPAGADSLKGLSPFKDERTPSFHVRPNHGYYHCFSTGKGGDVFNFLMEMEHITFPEAVELCAEKIGYRINYEGGGTGQREQPGTRQRLIAANREAHKYYVKQLSTADAATARDFLANRGFTKEHAEQFGCGYAPAGWDRLTRHLQQLGFSFEELEKAGLARMGKQGPIDRFHRRLLWPIKNMSGDVIGFGARKLFDDDKLGKYLNTPETMLYKKSKVLFGLDMAKHQIAQQRRAVVVEGYTDVMAMHAAGETTAVASCGTAFGEEHLQLLRRLMLDRDTASEMFRGELIYTFDGDEAGKAAAMKTFSNQQRFLGNSFVAVAPDGLDPCDLRLEHGDEAVRNLVAGRKPLIEFVVSTVLENYDIGDRNGRQQAQNHVISVLAEVANTGQRETYAREFSGWVAADAQEERFVAAVHAAAKQSAAKRAADREREERLRRQRQASAGDGSGGTGGEHWSEQQQAQLPSPDRKDPTLLAERETLKFGVQQPVLAGPVFDALTPDMFVQDAYRAIFEAIQKVGGVAAAPATSGPEWMHTLLEAVGDPVGCSLLTELGTEEFQADDDALPAYASGVMAALQALWVGDQVSQVKALLNRMRPSDDPKGYQQLYADLMALESYRQSLVREANSVGYDS